MHIAKQDPETKIETVVSQSRQEVRPYVGDEQELPHPTATPEEVREYLARLLIGQHIPPEDAHKIAGRWKWGYGRDLRNYPTAIFREIIETGEDTWTVYRAVRISVLREQEQKNGDKEELLHIAECLCTAIALFGAVNMITSDVKEKYKVLARVFILLAGPCAAGVMADLESKKVPLDTAVDYHVRAQDWRPLIR